VELEIIGSWRAIGIGVENVRSDPLKLFGGTFFEGIIFCILLKVMSGCLIFRGVDCKSGSLVESWTQTQQTKFEIVYLLWSN
jgi:uncharacterized integral membrane protein